MNLRWPYVALFLSFAPASSNAAQLDATRFSHAMDAYVAPLVTGDQLSGELLVAQNGRIVLERSWGYANRELKSPVTPETRFNIASITKPMTGCVERMLIAEGKLSMDDTLGKWISGFPSGDKITIRHLSYHMAGIPHRVTTEKDESQPLTPAEVVEYAKKSTLMFEPGEKSIYSSAGYTVLARVLELASGMSYADLMRTKLFEPLGMTHSSHSDNREIVPDRAASYVPGPKGWENAPLKDMSFLAGAGSITSTARDLHKFVEAVRLGKLGPENRAAWVRGGKINLNGSSNGFRANASWDSATGITTIITCNAVNGAADMILQAVPKLAAGQKLAPAQPPHFVTKQLPEALLRSYEGYYLVPGNIRTEVRAKNGGLSVSEWTLMPTSDTTFVSLRDWGQVSVILGEGNKVERFNWRIGDQTYPCPKVGELAER